MLGLYGPQTVGLVTVIFEGCGRKEGERSERLEPVGEVGHRRHEM
jgi:hypothetical protein